MSRSHGETRGGQSTEYRAFHEMKKRCNNTTSKFYPKYGGRGIKVCDEWQASGGFELFLAHVGRKPSQKHTLDRINNNGDYEPGNVRWATMKEQMRNTRRTRLITFRGETLCLLDMSKKYGLVRRTVDTRLKRGWSVEDALTVPPLPGTMLKFRHATRGEMRERAKAIIKKWCKEHPEKVKAYAANGRFRRKQARLLEQGNTSPVVPAPSTPTN